MAAAISATRVEITKCSNPPCKKTSEDSTLRRCLQCRQALYCGQTCQRADWPRHRPICKIHSELSSQMLTTTLPLVETMAHASENALAALVGKPPQTMLEKACRLYEEGKADEAASLEYTMYVTKPEESRKFHVWLFQHNRYLKEHPNLTEVDALHQIAEAKTLQLSMGKTLEILNALKFLNAKKNNAGL